MYEQFFKGMWAELRKLIAEQFLVEYPQLVITAGPIFDSNYDGLADDSKQIVQSSSIMTPYGKIAMPTHYFLIIERCDGGRFDAQHRCLSGQPKVLSFALPNIPKPVNYCQKTIEHLYMNTAKVRDIELLTGLQFFNQYDPMVAVKLRAHVNQDLW